MIGGRWKKKRSKLFFSHYDSDESYLMHVQLISSFLSSFLGPGYFLEYGIAVKFAVKLQIAFVEEHVPHLLQNSDILAMLLACTFIPIFAAKVPLVSPKRCRKFHR